MRWARSWGLGISASVSWTSAIGLTPNLVPVEEMVLEPRQGLVGRFASCILVANTVDHGLQHAQPARGPIGLGLVPALELGMDVGKELRFTLCRHGRGFQ